MMTPEPPAPNSSVSGAWQSRALAVSLSRRDQDRPQFPADDTNRDDRRDDLLQHRCEGSAGLQHRCHDGGPHARFRPFARSWQLQSAPARRSVGGSRKDAICRSSCTSRVSVGARTFLACMAPMAVPLGRPRANCRGLQVSHGFVVPCVRPRCRVSEERSRPAAYFFMSTIWGMLNPLRCEFLEELLAVEVRRHVRAPALELLEELLRVDAVAAAEPLALELLEELLAVEIGRCLCAPALKLLPEHLPVEAALAQAPYQQQPTGQPHRRLPASSRVYS